MSGGTVQDHAAKSFTCASCKRVRPKSQREKGRNRCRDRKNCAEATAAFLGRIPFAVGAAQYQRWT